MKQYHFTKEGYDKLKNERETLLKERPEAVGHLKKAREMGDLSENGYYKSSRMKLSQIDHRLFRLAMLLKYAKIIEAKKTGVVELGNTVTLKSEKETVTYMIVGSEEANPKEGKISNISPLGNGLLGKKIGDNCQAGSTVYKIISIE